MKSVWIVFGAVLKVIGTIIGVLGMIGGSILTRIAIPVAAVLVVLELTSVIQIGWTMVIAYPAMMLFGGLLLAGLSVIWTTCMVYLYKRIKNG